MHELYKARRYPPNVRAALATMPALATDIANRWMLGWPKTVRALIEDGTYLEVLKDTEEREREAYIQPRNAHLARHEIAELYDLSPAPPPPG